MARRAAMLKQSSSSLAVASTTISTGAPPQRQLIGVSSERSAAQSDPFSVAPYPSAVRALPPAWLECAFRAADLIRIDVSNLRNSKFRSSQLSESADNALKRHTSNIQASKRLSSGARADQRLFELFVMRHLHERTDCRSISPAFRIRRWQRVALANSSLSMAAEALSRMGWLATRDGHSDTFQRFFSDI